MNNDHDLPKSSISKRLASLHKAVIILLIPGTFLGLISITNFFSVKNITIEGVQEIRGIENYFGKNMLMLSTSNITSDLKNDNPKLSDLIITKKYPQSLSLIATLKHPSVTLKLADGYITLAEDGYIIQKNKEKPDSDVPLIHYYQPLFYNHYRVGDLFDNDDIQTVTHMTRRMTDSGVRVSSIDIASENMLVLHTEDFDVFMTSEKDADTQLTEFEYTYKKLKIDGMTFSSIDVRFEKPIIKLL